VDNQRLEEVPLSYIFADEEFNCRGTLNSLDVADLAKDIREKGLIQPVSLIPFNTPPFKYRLIAGFRRFLAHRVNKAVTISAVISERVMTEVEARVFNLAENLQRKQLDILQEARAISKLHQLGLAEADVAQRLGVSRGWVQVRYMILTLPTELYPDILAGTITQTQIRQLATVFRLNGRDGCFNVAKKMKEDRVRGINGRDYSRVKTDGKRARNRTEIQDLMTHLYDNLPGLTYQIPICRALAWASGEISDLDLHNSLKEWASEQEIIYAIPVEILPIPPKNLL